MTTNIDNLMGMGRSAELARNNDEAISYYNRVLEADPTYSEAWFGKGRAAGWLSSLANIRINETVVAFGHAIGSSESDERQARAERAADEIGPLVQALYKMARDHAIQFPTVADSQAKYITISATLLDVLTNARQWNPNNRANLETEVLIARQLLDRGTTPEYGAVLRSQMDDANTRLEAIDPEYKRPGLAAKTEAQVAQEKADFDNLGYVVLFIVLVLGAIITAASR